MGEQPLTHPGLELLKHELAIGLRGGTAVLEVPGLLVSKATAEASSFTQLLQANLQLFRRSGITSESMGLGSG